MGVELIKSAAPRRYQQHVAERAGEILELMEKDKRPRSVAAKQRAEEGEKVKEFLGGLADLGSQKK